MSAPDASSIPTSSRPGGPPRKKRRALSPTSSQAQSLSQLFAHPETEIAIPKSCNPPPRKLPAPPEIVTNVQGSSAGAGSGEFHVYKAARRREYERLRVMDEEVAREKEAREFEAAKREREVRDEERTRKNREKREKKKQRGKQKGKNDMGPGGGGGGTSSEKKDRGSTAENGNQEGDETKMSEKVDEGGVPTKAAPAVADGPGLVIHDDD